VNSISCDVECYASERKWAPTSSEVNESKQEMP